MDFVWDASWIRPIGRISPIRLQFSKEVIAEGAGDVGESIAVEEEERRAPMTGAEVVEGVAERGF